MNPRSGAFRLVPNSPSGPFVDEVFEAVVDLPTAERDEALSRWCRGHPSVEVEVRQLLAADHQPPSARVPQQGDHYGSFRLEELLGRGSSGTVWRAFDAHLQAWTALKIVRPRPGDEAALERVMREARAASAILSDHVVRVKGAGVFPEGLHYIEMQLCAEYRPGPVGEQLVVGRTLADVGGLSPDEVARMVAAAARGVDDAHRIGVVHRDLKPQNILILPVSRRALVSDFGLASPGFPLRPTVGMPATTTVTVEFDGGRIVGTPAFMAPEQARGVTPDRASDIYALGATLYALLAGRPPYVPDGRDPVPALDVIAQVCAGPPSPLDGVNRRLAAIVARAMARHPSERYPTAAALAADLEAWRAARTTSVDGPSLGLGARLFVVRNREVAGTAAIMATLLGLSGLGLMVLEQRREALEVASRHAEHRRAAAETQAVAAEAVQRAAEAERDSALSEANAAIQARDLARLGESAAMKRATEEIHARQQAELAAREAEVARRQAEQSAATEAELRATLAAELSDTQRALAEAETRLDAARAAHALAEADRDQLESQLQQALTEVDALRATVTALQDLAVAPVVAGGPDAMGGPALE
jgi:hypothetical protein